MNLYRKVVVAVRVERFHFRNMGSKSGVMYSRQGSFLPWAFSRNIHGRLWLVLAASQATGLKQSGPC